MTAVRTRRRYAVAALTVVAVVLTACTPIKTGSAAIAGADTLRENDLSTLASEITALASEKEVELPDPSQLNQRIIAVWVDERLTTALADELEVTATQANVDDLLAQFSDEQLTQIAVGSGIAPSALQEAARAAVLRQAISQSVAADAKTQDEQLAALSKAYLDTAKKLGVSINPRYATWNASTAQVEPRVDGLSQLAEPVVAPETTLPSGG